MRYIDAEKLKAEIEELCSGSCISESDDYYEYAKSEILDIIDSLQQEQPMPSCKSCGFYENNCPFIRDTFKPYPNKVCKDYTYSAMKEQEQPEEDLEKETRRWWKEHLHLNPENQLWMDAHQSVVFARHFYELGLNARNKK